MCSPITAYLQIAGSVEEKVRGLKVAVEHVGRVDVLEPSEDLVQEVANVVVAQVLGLQQLVQVRLHQILYDVAGESIIKEVITPK